MSAAGTEELLNMLEGFKAGIVSYEDMQRFLGHIQPSEDIEVKKRTRQSGIRANRNSLRYIQTLKRKPGRPYGSKTTTERNLVIILIMISSYEEWKGKRKGRRDHVIEVISRRIGRNINKRSIERVIKEWSDFKNVAVYDDSDSLSLLRWEAMVENFKDAYLKKYGIKEPSALRFLKYH